MLLTGLVLFTLASLGCALAPDDRGLIVLRFFQALGASAPSCWRAPSYVDL